MDLVNIFFNYPAQKVMDLSNPDNLLIRFNIIFNYQQKSGKFLDCQNDCQSHTEYEKIHKPPKTECLADYKVPEYAFYGK